MQFEKDKISSYYHASTKKSFFFYRTSIIVSMLVLMGGLGLHLYSATQVTSTMTKAAGPGFPTLTPTPFVQTTPIPTRPPLPPQCEYQQSTNGLIVVCKSSNGQTFNIPLPE